MLVDRFGRKHTYLRISLTDRCNMRCLYCMPPEGIEWKQRDEILTLEEIVRVARVFVDLGIEKIRLTGGEPTVRRNLPHLISELATLDGLQSLAMTTNGVYLKGNVGQYKSSGLTALNVSLDTLKPDRFDKITRRPYFHQVMEGVEEALAVGFVPLKLNVVVMAGVNDDEILDFVRFAQDKPINVRFIEFMPFKGNQWQGGGLVSYDTMKSCIEEHYSLIPICTEPSAVAKDFAIEGFQGTVSFITSMTESFCDTCSRMRLTAEGSVKSCLFFHPEISIRSALRSGASDDDLAQLIYSALALKPEGHPPLEELASAENRTMIEIGG